MNAQGSAKRGRDRLLGQGACLVAIGLIATGCLPGDDRPEPGSIFVTAEPTDATAHGFLTPDGWSVRFDRFVTALGHLGLNDPEGKGGTPLSAGSCTDYAETEYDWLFDFTVAEREKVALGFGLGTCSVDFDVRPPSSDSVLGPGATEQDITFMRITGSDAYAQQERVALVVQGQAERSGVTKRFDWAFRHRYTISECPDGSGNGWLSVVRLRGGDALTLRIEVRGEELFRLAPLDDAVLQFDPFADADADGDGFITMEELGKVDAPAGSIPAGVEPPVDPGAGGLPPSLAGVVYWLLLPRITRIAGGGACKAEADWGYHH